MHSRPWTHYAAPAAFLLGVTVAVLLVRSATTGADRAGTATVAVPTVPRRTVTRATTTTKTGTTAKPPAAARFYTVVAGDTFGAISTKTGVPVATIQQLNPNVQSTALYIGQKLRLR